MSDNQTQIASRLVGGTLVLVGIIWIALLFGSVQRTSQIRPVPPVWSPPSPRTAVRTSSGWPGVVFLEVRAYYSSKPFSYPFKQHGIPDSVEDSDGVLLNEYQVRQLISAVTARLEPYDVFSCWFPRHAFVFYDPFGEPVAEVDICFQCFVVEGGPSDTPDIGALAELTTDLGLPLGVEGTDGGEYRKAFETRRKEHPLKEW